MIVAAVQTSGPRKLLTENLNHGRNYGGILVINPFFFEARVTKHR